MRPIKISIAPVTASLTGFRSNATGVDFTLTVTAPTDGLAHKVTIKNDSATDHSAKTVIITGTDADGNAQVESGATTVLPAGSATVTYTKYFKTVTSVVPSATIGADTMDIGWAAPSVTQTIPIEWRSNATAALSCVVTGTINFTPQQIPANVWNETNVCNNGAWNTAIAAGTATVAGTATLGSTAVRILTNTVTNGATIDFYISQPSGFVI